MVSDGLIALWVLGCLAATTIAVAHGRSVLLWFALAIVAGPITPLILVIKGNPLGSALHARLCNDCFVRVSDHEFVCQRCRNKQKRD